MTFGAAFNKLRTRTMQLEWSPRIARKVWGKGVYVRIYVPVFHENASLPIKNCFLFKETRDGSEPWLPTNEDLFAQDWELYE